MSKHVVYYPASNEAGYIWESVEADAVELFLQRGWFANPGELKRHQESAIASIESADPEIPVMTLPHKSRKPKSKTTDEKRLAHTIVKRGG